MKASLRRRLSIAAGILMLVPCVAAAQRPGGVTIVTTDPQGVYLAGVPIDVDQLVTNAPYSADAITTVTQTLGDGTKIERSVTAKIYRDGMGRVRREQTVIGLASLTPAQDSQRTITITDPVERVTITLDERAKIARRVPMPGFYFRQTTNGSRGVFFRTRSDAANLWPLLGDLEAIRLRASVGDVADQLNTLQGRGGRGIAPGTAGPATSLGTRTIEGVVATGKRTTQTIPAGQIGNDRPIVISDEVWESDALKAVLVSKHVDPRTGTVDYKLTNIKLGEPAADLFTVPQGYTITGNAPAQPALAPASPGSSPAGAPQPAPPSPPGGRSGGRGGRGPAPGTTQQ